MSTTRLRKGVEFICDGVNDNVEVQAAIDYVFISGKSARVAMPPRGIIKISKEKEVKEK